MLAPQILVKITAFVVELDRSLCASVEMVFKEKPVQVNNIFSIIYFMYSKSE